MNDENSLALVPPTHVGDLPALMQLATQLVPTGMLPDHIKTPGQAVAIIISGRELGIGPMVALRSIYMIKGKIELSADLQLSLFKRDGGKAEFTELTDTRAVLKLKHPNGDAHTESFSMEDAKRAMLGGDNWKKYPKAMLRSRVITAGLKSLGFEPKMSGCYAPGEIGGPEVLDIETVPEQQQQPEPPKQQKPSPKADGADLKERIALFTKWLYEHVGADVAGWAIPYLRSHTPDGGEQSSALMPNEDLTGLTEASLGAIRKDIAGFLKRLGEYAEANKPKIEVPRDADAAKKADDLWWKETEIHFGQNKGTKLGDIDTKTLFGWWANWQPEPVSGTTDEFTISDQDLRKALDACGEHYNFKKK